MAGKQLDPLWLVSIGMAPIHIHEQIVFNTVPFLDLSTCSTVGKKEFKNIEIHFA